MEKSLCDSQFCLLLPFSSDFTGPLYSFNDYNEVDIKQSHRVTVKIAAKNNEKMRRKIGETHKDTHSNLCIFQRFSFTKTNMLCIGLPLCEENEKERKNPTIHTSTVFHCFFLLEQQLFFTVIEVWCDTHTERDKIKKTVVKFNYSTYLQPQLWLLFPWYFSLDFRLFKKNELNKMDVFRQFYQ